MKKLLTLLVALLFVAMSFSQIPEKMSYQALVRSSSGLLVRNSPVGIKITIMPESKGLVYSETHIATTNDDGLVTLEIGGGTVVYGTFSSINWSEGAFHLMTEIDPTGGTDYTITGTSQILSVPYAFYSKLADYNSLLNKPLLFDGTWTSLAGKPALSTVATTGIYNDLLNKPTILNSQWITSGSNIYYNAGNVGIGTVNTTSRVVVQPPASWDDNVPLFEVKNKTGVPIFAVYNNGVRILVDHSDTKGAKGGFAVGGYDMSKAGKTVDFMTISPDSIRFNINNQNTKGAKGGFAVGGFDASKGPINQDFMYITPQISSNGQYNTFLGFQSGYNNKSTGLYNSFVGYNSGYSNTTGGYNVFLGYQAGSNSTNTGYNTFIGYQAGQNTATNLDPARDGASNVFIGQQAGQYVTTGCRSVLIGMYAGLYWTGGGLSDRSNVFIGYDAGSGTADGATVGSAVGNYNTYIGTEAAKRMLTGDWNVYIGHAAGVENRYGNRNVLIGGSVNYGLAAGRTSTANDNIYIGYTAAGRNSAGINNVMIGTQSGFYNYGSSNIFIGYQAGFNESGSDKLYIDNSNTTTPLIYGDFTNGSEKLVFNGNVGIGALSPSRKLEIGGTSSSIYLNSATSNVVEFSTQGVAAPSFTSRSVGTKIVLFPGITASTSDYAIGIDNASIWMSVPNTASYFKYYAGITELMRIQGDGKIGIGTTAPANKLDVSGTIRTTSSDTPSSGTGVEIGYIAGSSTGYILCFDRGSSSYRDLRLGGNILPNSDNIFTLGASGSRWISVWAANGTIQTSDFRLKNNIASLNYGLESIMKLNPVSYTWKDDANNKKYLGLVAQDVVSIINEVVDIGDDPDKTLGINYSQLVPVLIKGIQEQQLQIESTKQENQQLKSELQVLKDKMERIEAMLAQEITK